MRQLTNDKATSVDITFCTSPDHPDECDEAKSLRTVEVPPGCSLFYDDTQGNAQQIIDSALTQGIT